MSGSRSLGLASALRGVVCMVTYCLNRTNFPSSLSSRFGRFCCGGVEKDEEPTVDQPGFNCAAVDPWSYVGPVMEPQNGRLLFRKGMWSQQEDAVPAFSQQPSPPGSEHHSWSNARPATEPDQPEFGGSSRSLGLASVLRGVVCMVTYCLNRTNFPSSLSSRFGRFCCGGVEKDEEPTVYQPGFNCAAVDPWSYVGPVMEPQNGRLVFRKGMWSQQEDAVPAFSQQPSPPGSEHHSWSNARPATEPDQPEFGGIPGYPGWDLFVDAGLRRVGSEANALVRNFK
ncbi:hypothetical protein JTE90_013497 [Oedothorax gibbosus]|uniref:Uncharacterized protein n=1 Tax=Oedothorax gibbosus TaxID=931172 RepID=A0AAV6VNH8_9ARAC|nr:hypothetical protein JTE90_013497 [Oedothorax gibbosus]